MEEARSRRLRGAIEATRLGFGLTDGAIAALARAAGKLRVAGVCIPGAFVCTAASVASEVEGWTPDIVTVANFPTGDHDVGDVLAQTRRAGRDGAGHIDLVARGEFVMDRRWSELREFVRSVREQAEQSSGRALPIKVILETAALGDEEVRRAASAAIEAGARWLKTSTGFHPAGGATERAVRLLRSIAPPEVGVKASGGIRTTADALRMLNAGADRIGTSSEAAVMGE
ncbi:MAG: deoxyribose-phosphate aldolase [Gemmatimonadota bacterium]